MKPLQLFLVSALVYALLWRIVDTRYPDPSIGWWWGVVAALLGGVLTEGFRRVYRRAPSINITVLKETPLNSTERPQS